MVQIIANFLINLKNSACNIITRLFMQIHTFMNLTGVGFNIVFAINEPILYDGIKLLQLKRFLTNFV